MIYNMYYLKLPSWLVIAAGDMLAGVQFVQLNYDMYVDLCN